MYIMCMAQGLEAKLLVSVDPNRYHCIAHCPQQNNSIPCIAIVACTRIALALSLSYFFGTRLLSTGELSIIFTVSIHIDLTPNPFDTAQTNTLF